MTSIRRRLTIGMFAWLFFILGLGGAGLYGWTRAVLLSEFDSGLQARSRAMAMLVKQDRGQLEMDFSDDFMPAFERKDRPEYFQVRFEDGRTFERSISLGDTDLPQRFGALDSPEFWNLVLPDGRAGRAIGVRFAPQRDEEDLSEIAAMPVSLVIAKDRAELDRALQALGMALLGVGTLIFAGTAFVIKRVVRRGLSPLAIVADRAGRIDAATLTSRFPIENMPAELKPICGRLNELLARLEESFQRERRFTADVAHELRTPIAELRSLSEVAIKWPEEALQKKETVRAFQDALDIAKQMEGTVTALLAVARCEAGQQAIRHERVHLAGFCEKAWNAHAESAQAKRLDVWFHTEGDMHLDTDPAMLRSILDNLFSNAVYYTPAGGCVDIRFASSGEEFTLTVVNTNPGLAPEDISHLFEPFWRKDQARSDSSHSGLGLTVAAEFARALSFELTADLSDRKNFRICLAGRRST